MSIMIKFDAASHCHLAATRHLRWHSFILSDFSAELLCSIPVSSTILNVPYKLDSPMNLKSHGIKSEPPGVFTHSRSFNLEYAPNHFVRQILNPETQAQAVGFNLGLIFNTRIHIQEILYCLKNSSRHRRASRLSPSVESFPAIFPSYRPGISSRIVFDLSFSPRLYLLNPIELQNPSLIFAISIAFQVFNGFCAREGQCYYDCMARSEVTSTRRQYAYITRSCPPSPVHSPQKTVTMDVHFMFTMLSEHWDVVTIAQQHALEATRASALCLCRLPFAADYPASLPTSTFRLVGLTPRTLLPVIFVISSGHTILAQRVSTTLIAGDTFGISGYVPLGFWI
ncbi:hypothetical protein B0H13DRAFT_1896122 [Mycena leptocephala]|nr:hypothetical protein B0H13DRAFT_1896122 [Mycena leptocephala]